MKISYNWLKQFLQLDWKAEQTEELLTDLGLEVEGISKFESIKGSLEGVLVGHVLTCKKHPNADRLKVTTVDIGMETPVQIVCGAPNVDVGQKVPVATVGTTLYFNENEPWKIKKSKIRGEESLGMICAADELGLNENHDGILVLDEDLEPGTLCNTVFEIETDQVFEIGLTPNRSDAMSHFGVARDLKAGLEQKEIIKELITPSTSTFSIDNRSLKLDIEVQNNALAPRYCGVTISNVLVQESPSWLKNRLKSIGLSPINNIVDITNYVMHELGQPLHAFDASKIKGNKIIVKTVAKGTKFTTLDGVERELHDDDLMICDNEKPICIAGVFGGLHSGVSTHTTSLFLESAYFDAVSIRKTAKRHGLNTDASFRFERGIDINTTQYALKRAALLIKEIAGGEITSDIIDLYPKKKDDFQVFVTFEKIYKLIGQEIPKDTIKSILSALEIKINNVTESGLGLTIPSYRADVQREVDVIEEILRVYGYNNIDYKEKFTASIARTAKVENYKLQNIVGDLLASRGFFEIMTNSLVPNKNSKNVENNVSMLNPLSMDLAVLRESMLLSGLMAISHNQNRRKNNLKLFEFGKTYLKQNDSYKEEEHLSIFVTGNQYENSWTSPDAISGFYYLKGICESIFSRIGLQNCKQIEITQESISEGISFKKGKQVFLSMGVVNKSFTSKLGIKNEVLFADFNWDILKALVTTNEIVFQEIPKFPDVNRDFALLLDENIKFIEVYDIAFQTEHKFLKAVNLFDVYTGNNLPKGKKSYAISFTLLDTSKTLTDSQIEKIMTKLKNAYVNKIGAELR